MSFPDRIFVRSSLTIIDDSNTINLKLFPTRPPPPPILAHQVPLLTITLSSLQTPISSDLTLNRILPFINGVNSISRIAQLADTDLSLTRRAIQHLIYYGCLVLLDIFSFGAIYAPTAEIVGFIVDADVKEECSRYVRVPRLRMGSDAKTVRAGSESEISQDDRDSTSSSTSQQNETTSSNVKAEDEWHIDHETLITLYASLRQGLTLKNWVLENLDLLSGIDVRRFITFGIIKGFLYRVHKYAIAASTVLPPAPPTSLQTSAATSIVNPSRDSDTATIRGHAGVHHHPNPTSHVHTPSFSLHRPSIASTTSLNPHIASGQNLNPTKSDDLHGLDTMVSDRERNGGLPLLKFLDGMHCFDEICTELGLAEKEVEGKVRAMGEGLGVVIHR